MNRYDVNNDDWTGYAIFKDGAPFQAMYRIHGPSPSGLDLMHCWLRPVDGDPPPHIVRFLCACFLSEMIDEARLT